MMLLFRGAELFDPRPRGHCDVLVGGGEVLAVAPAGSLACDAETVDVSGRLLLPGLVDALTHPCGGGGEGGYGNRTAEMDAEDFIRAGVTCPVGALGTDSLGRSLDVLFGTTMALRARGLAARMYSGAYRVPAPTLTGDVARDIYLVAAVIGIGEVAIADHRGTQPSVQELRRLAAETQLGGILAGEGGTVLVHVGAGDSRLSLLRAVIESSDLAPRVLYPTHVNRSTALLDEAAAWTVAGGFVDITVSTTPELLAKGDIPALVALRHLLDAGARADGITFSSDAGGSLPLYIDGELRGITAATVDCLPVLLAEVYRDDPALFPCALAALTSNPARALRLAAGAGELSPGHSADLVVFDAGGAGVQSVLCRGRWLLRDGELCPSP